MGNSTPIDVDDIWERIETRVNKTSSCWLWSGPRVNGYGKYRWHPDAYRVHRVAYQALVGDIPDGHDLDHLCRVRHCCNPDHLEPVVAIENNRRGILAARQDADPDVQRCPQGHPWATESIYINSRGIRECRTCRAGAR